MELVHKFEVPLDVEAAWRFANDPASAVPCMPGAVFEGIDPDGKLRGRIKVKLGAMVSNFAIQARYVDVDPVRHTMKVVSEGSEAKGGGRTSAEIVMKIAPKNDAASLVDVTIQLRMTGKIAQFGRGLLQDVSEALLAQFLSNVKAKAATLGTAVEQVPHGIKSTVFTESAEQPPSGRTDTGSSSDADVESSGDAIDLLRVGRSALLKRMVPVAVGLALLISLGCVWVWMGGGFQ